jgi:hypothetical protein
MVKPVLGGSLLFLMRITGSSSSQPLGELSRSFFINYFELMIINQGIMIYFKNLIKPILKQGDFPECDTSQFSKCSFHKVDLKFIFYFSKKSHLRNNWKIKTNSCKEWWKC